MLSVNYATVANKPIMLSAIMLNVVILSTIMLNVAAHFSKLNFKLSKYGS
jgi:hypothetical protein